MRYVDHLLPAHALASLQALAQLLGTLDANARPTAGRDPKRESGIWIILLTALAS